MNKIISIAQYENGVEMKFFDNMKDLESYRQRRGIKVGELVVYEQITIEEYLEGVSQNG